VRKALLVFILSIVLIAAATGATYAQCGGCQPSVKPNYTPGSAMTVYLAPGLTQNEVAAANGAVSAWNAWFVQNGYPAPYSITTNSGTANITIAEDPALHNTGIAGSTTAGQITLNPDYANRSDGFLPNVASHEMGHAIGFTDVGGNCQGQTVMFGSITPGGPYTTGPTSVDTCQLSQFVGSSGSGSGELENQCGQDSGCAEPIIFNLNDGSDQLSGLEDPVRFDIFAIGPRGGKPEIGWTARGSELAFLSIDRNGNGVIDGGGELFGTGTLLKSGEHAPNGFSALAEYDDNGDGQIDAQDSIWPYLLLWTDRNHDGLSQLSELQLISASAITAIELAHHWTNRRDGSGNVFGYEGLFREGKHERKFFDVFFVIGH